MSETIGQRTYATLPELFVAGATANCINASEVTDVAKAFDRATQVLSERRADLDEGRLLLAQETVTADQFPAIRSAKAKRAGRVRTPHLLSQFLERLQADTPLYEARKETHGCRTVVATTGMGGEFQHRVYS